MKTLAQKISKQFPNFKENEIKILSENETTVEFECNEVVYIIQINNSRIKPSTLKIKNLITSFQDLRGKTITNVVESFNFENSLGLKFSDGTFCIIDTKPYHTYYDDNCDSSIDIDIFLDSKPSIQEVQTLLSHDY